MQKNRSIKPKIRWKAKKSPDAWQGQHRALEVQQALTGSYHSQKSFQAPVPHGPGAFSVAGGAGAARGRPPRYPPVRCGAPLPGPAAGAAQPGAPPPLFLFLRQTVQRRQPVQAGASVFDARERYKLPCPVGKSKKLSLSVLSEGRKERQFCDCQKIQTKKQGPVSRALSAAGPGIGPV